MISVVAIIRHVNSDSEDSEAVKHLYVCNT